MKICISNLYNDNFIIPIFLIKHFYIYTRWHRREWDVPTEETISPRPGADPSLLRQTLLTAREDEKGDL